MLTVNLVTNIIVFDLKNSEVINYIQEQYPIRNLNPNKGIACSGPSTEVGVDSSVIYICRGKRNKIDNSGGRRCQVHRVQASLYRTYTKIFSLPLRVQVYELIMRVKSKSKEDVIQVNTR